MSIKNAVATLVDSNNSAVASVLTSTWSIAGNATTYNTVIAFSPQGEATLDPDSRTLDSWIKLQIAEFRGGVAHTQNTAAIKISGPSGQSIVLRSR